jgi:RimJ/RimL family protein N-acetyltransferase
MTGDDVGDMSARSVRIEPWDAADRPLLQALNGDPSLMAHLGGPESREKIAERHARYLAGPEGDSMFKIVEGSAGEGVGWVGFWEREWRGEQVYEIGWSLIPAFQGRGIASAAAAEAIAIAASRGGHRYAHAFPSVANAPSNAICRKLGFTLVEEREFEYPPGRSMRCNDWRLDLRASG